MSFHENRTFYFIVNPTSKSGKGKQLWKMCEKELKRQHLKYHIDYTGYEFHAQKFASEICKKDPGQAKTIVAIGGDGTVNEIINGITDFDNVRFGYIPTGSSNDFARGMGIPSKAKKALDCIIFPRNIKEIDVGTVQYETTTKRFGGSSGIGFDASVCAEAYSSPIKDFLNKIYLGSLTYVVIALKQFIMYKPTSMTLTIDSDKTYHYKRSYFICVLNQTCEGGGFDFCPHADPTDGYLDVCVAGDVSKLKFVCLFPFAFLGKHENVNGVDLFRCKTCHIKSSEPLPIHRDGEPCQCHDEVTMSILPKKLKICAA